ncbi:MAG: hypothetical protein AB7P08_12845 [Burkholderiales bacterium]
MSFEARLAEIERQLRDLGEQPDVLGSVALIFRGDPVHGSRSIDATFVSEALGEFQDMVTKRVAAEEVGELGERGPLPVRARTSLGVANMVRGSVGFVLEEQTANLALADTLVKRAVDEVVAIIGKAASESDEQFEDAIQAMDNRFLVSLKAFFKTLDESRAQARIIDADRESQLDTSGIARARIRLDRTEIEDREDEVMVGELLGLLPDSPPKFTMLLEAGHETIRGSVAARVAEQYRAQIEIPGNVLVGRWWRVRMKIREIREPNRPLRRSYTLLGLLEQLDGPPGVR